MEGFRKENYIASRACSIGEFVVIVLAILLVVFVVTPNVFNILNRIKINSAIDSVYSYRESINNYYVSQLMFDSSFKLDGYYEIVDGNLVTEADSYNIFLVGNVPTTGYLDYRDNVLKNGCIVVDNYSVIVSDGSVVSASKGNCENYSLDFDVAFGM